MHWARAIDGNFYSDGPILAEGEKCIGPGFACRRRFVKIAFDNRLSLRLIGRRRKPKPAIPPVNRQAKEA
jgi:hypothetical protein